jgi:hypothetical protein
VSTPPAVRPLLADAIREEVDHVDAIGDDEALR